MEAKDYISIQQFCVHYNIPMSFLNTLQEYELLEVYVEKEMTYISQKQIKKVEKLIRLHFDLDINMEGLDVVEKLLKRIEILQDEITDLNNKIKFYEEY